jgi:hypothetical protein
MRIDVLARRWGGPNGGPDGMAIAASFLAWTLCELGHRVRGYTQAATPWLHGHMDWHRRAALHAPDDFAADLVITTIHPVWRRTVAAARDADALHRLIYWHHHGGLPDGHGCMLAAPPVVTPETGWGRSVVLPPSSWAVETGGRRTGEEILVPGAGPAKGGHVAAAVARLCPDLRWYVLPGRCSGQDLEPWRALPHSEVAQGQVAPPMFLSRARAILSPTRFEIHPLTLVEAAVRGIPIVCSDLPATRAAAGDGAIYVPMTAPPEDWLAALREALRRPTPRLHLRPYTQVVAEALEQFTEQRLEAVA